MWQLKDWWRVKREKIITGIVWALPREIVYWAAIRLMSHATMGIYGQCHPDSVTIMEALERWENRHE